MSVGEFKLVNVRLSHPSLFTPTQYQGAGPFRYEATVHIEDDAQILMMKDIFAAVAAQKWKEKAKAMLALIESNPNRNAFIDGALKGYPGVYVLSMKRPADKGAPAVVDAHHTKAKPAFLTEASGRPYAGCFVNVTGDVFAYDNTKAKGMSATVAGVQFVKDGPGFSAVPPASADAFDDVSGDGADGLA